jgi:hypothetical protein
VETLDSIIGYIWGVSGASSTFIAETPVVGEIMVSGWAE